jgi:hypothetical protein
VAIVAVPMRRRTAPAWPPHFLVTRNDQPPLSRAALFRSGFSCGSLDNFTHCALGSAERADATDAGANVTAGKERRMARLV